jgi:hypothetical protein
MFYQLTHGKPLVEGKIARPPREALAFINTVPFLAFTREHLAVDAGLTDVSRELERLSEANVRYVILHKAFMGTDQLARWRDWLTIEPHCEDDDLVVYRTNPEMGQDFVLETVLADGIGGIRATSAPGGITQAGLIEVDARWGSSRAPERDYDVCVNLVSTDGRTAQYNCGPLSAAWPSSEWGPNAVVRGSYSLQVDPFLKPGTYTVALTLAEPSAQDVVGEPLTAGPLEVRALPREFAQPAPEHTVDARWGDVIVLHGYDLQRSADMLDLTLYWQATRRMQSSYKVFVHLVDSNGAIVTQADVVPRQWTYPTTWWERGEVVTDSISLALDDVGNGEFHLLLGLTDQATGDRLAVYTSQGDTYSSEVLPLASFSR